MPIYYDNVSKNANAGTELMLRGLEKRLDPSLIRQCSIGRAIGLFKHNTDKKIYWTHNLPGQRMPPEVEDQQTLSSPDKWRIIDQVVFVSEWQRNQYAKHFKFTQSDIAKTVVLKNAIDPIPVHEKPTDKIRLIYTSVPNRGLELLSHAFDVISQRYNDVELEVFSSFKLYGADANADMMYRSTFDKLKANPHVKCHGTVSNEEIRKAFQRSHIFAYPSNYQETSCISLIEAMSAKCLCVHPNIAALPETSNGLTHMYEYSTNRKEQFDRCVEYLDDAIKMIRSKSIDLTKQKQYADEEYSWDNRIAQWENYLKRVLNES